MAWQSEALELPTAEKAHSGVEQRSQGGRINDTAKWSSLSPSGSVAEQVHDGVERRKVGRTGERSSEEGRVVGAAEQRREGGRVANAVE
jgi:hypothetical protein